MHKFAHVGLRSEIIKHDDIKYNSVLEVCFTHVNALHKMPRSVFIIRADACISPKPL